ncbi:uncharacterized protein LOC132195001 [Neocloeon triangulifer]|uniref:uncharacterized protein LOC132195001 n=1 Tax=Neocloeon triangulifer TaxID=2078957 RepID=UPI00286F0CB2|nr:uncharacterized protein LOC132195001 [Neocloeon triangulifer]
MLADFTESRKALRKLQEEKRRVSREMTKLVFADSSRTNDVDYQVKEVLDTLIGGITRVAPPEILQPVVDHIRSHFSEYLKRHSILVGNSEPDEATLEGSSSNRSSYTNASVNSLERELERKTAAKEELLKRHVSLDEELKASEIENNAACFTEEDKLELESIKATMAEIQEGINEFRSQQESLSARSEKLNSRVQKGSSLMDLFQGAIVGVKDPYPDLRRSK